jgi:hypothetical protein
MLRPIDAKAGEKFELMADNAITPRPSSPSPSHLAIDSRLGWLDSIALLVRVERVPGDAAKLRPHAVGNKLSSVDEIIQ